MYRIDRLYRHLEFSLALPLVVTKLTRIATYAFFLIHWVSVCSRAHVLQLGPAKKGGMCVYEGGGSTVTKMT
jgi:hypothetical protein